MLGAAWVCVLALALPCWTYPSGHKTTCDEFGRGITFDPMNAIGEWFTVYVFTGQRRNFTETITIRELTASKLQQHEQVLRGYSKDKLKLEFNVYDSHPIILDVGSVMVSQDDAGNAWFNTIRIGDLSVDDYAPISVKWNSVNGFLVVMFCNNQRVYVLSKTVTPDEDKLQQAMDSLNIDGIAGNRVYSSLLT